VQLSTIVDVTNAVRCRSLDGVEVYLNLYARSNSLALTVAAAAVGEGRSKRTAGLAPHSSSRD
jgi:hypothetical protein